MDGTANPWTDLRRLLLLFIIAISLRAWQIGTTELTSRDSVAYIRYAWRLEHEPLRDVVTKEIHHPGYGFLVLAVSQPVRLLYDGDLPAAMQLSAQLAAGLAGVLLVIPMYFLGKSLFDARVGFWTSLLFQLLPSSGRLMADGLSESLFLLLVTTSLYFLSRSLAGGGVSHGILGGVCAGLAYLTRTEGLIVVPAALVVFLLQRRERWLLKSAALTASCAAVTVPFMLLIGGISLKASFKNITDGEGWKIPARPAAALVITPMPFAIWNIDPGVRPEDRTSWAVRALLVTLDKSFFHVFGPLALLGVWMHRRRLGDAPGSAVLLIMSLALLGLLWRLGVMAGYIGERHVLLIVLSGMYFAVAAVGSLLGRWPAWTTVAFLVLGGACLPKTLAPLHANRSGFRDAGRWLAENSKPGDDVFDPLAWTSYHAGRLFVGKDAPRSDPPACYVVLEEAGSEHAHLWYLMDLANDLVRNGVLVHRTRQKRGADIVIYRVARPAEKTEVGHRLQVWLNVNMGRRAQ